MKAITDTMEVARSNQYRERTPRRRYNKKPDDEEYLPHIRKIINERPTYGYRRVTALLRRELQINHKKVYRIMRTNNLLLPKYTGKVVRSHEGTIITLHSNMRWCSDGFEIPCRNGERVRVAFAMDCSDREIMAFAATNRGITAEMIKDLMAEAIEYRFGLVDQVPHTIEWLTDNGSAYTSHETLRFARMMGLEPCTTPYRSPESNGMAESFIKTFKRDYVFLNDLPEAVTVMEMLTFWFEDYNENHPHKGLKMKSPRQHRQAVNKLERCPV
ncbi:MAG: IS2 transposase TnpB [Syntrophorhabdus sp. PtaB.Bin006]|nr:MAG: IS2 transposase TnpB [Syntrophorhabdus sp. PtaB.Bin006]